MDVLRYKTLNFDHEQGLECCLIVESLPSTTHSSSIEVQITSSYRHEHTHALENEENYDFYDIELQQKPRKSKLLRRIWKRFTKIGKHRRGPQDDGSSTGTNSTACISINSSIESDDGTGTPLIQTRLLKTEAIDSIHDIEFVQDKVSKEVIGLYGAPSEEHGEKGIGHVKTGVWKVTQLDEGGQALETFYIVTGISMDDRVDTKKLRKAIFAGKSFNRRPKLEMAPREIAEKLTGYESGTMAPICHSVDMKLFLEKSLVEGVDLSVHKINVGSGMFGKCLSLSAEKFLGVANASTEGVELCSIIQNKKQTEFIS